MGKLSVLAVAGLGVVTSTRAFGFPGIITYIIVPITQHYVKLTNTESSRYCSHTKVYIRMKFDFIFNEIKKCLLLLALAIGYYVINWYQ